jgi:hypothetical protein
MTNARREVFDPHAIGVYHCISRCVRRAYLCGFDSYSNRSYEHRRDWVRERISFLTEIFAFDAIAYAIMENHNHNLLRNRPDLAELWTPEEVARRWRTLFPLKRAVGKSKVSEKDIRAITSRPKLVALYRERLSSISWFQRCLSEHIAKKANKEDQCTGRFWEGRFKCQRVHDISGLITCSAYIDLNPIRAKKAVTFEESDYTSIQDRVLARKEVNKDDSESVQQFRKKTHSLKLISIEEATQNQLTEDEYLTLVDATGRSLVEGKGAIPDHIEPILTRLRINSKNWMNTTTHYHRRFRRMVGPVEKLEAAAARVGKAWFQGLVAAKLSFL